MAEDYTKKIKLNADISALEKAIRAYQDFIDLQNKVAANEKKRAEDIKNMTDEQIEAYDKLNKQEQKQLELKNKEIDLINKVAEAERKANAAAYKYRDAVDNKNQIEGAESAYNRIKSFRSKGVTGGLQDALSRGKENVSGIQSDIDKLYDQAHYKADGTIDRRTKEWKEIQKLEAARDSEMAGISSVSSAMAVVEVVKMVGKSIKKVARDVNDAFKSVFGISLSIKENFQQILKSAGDMARIIAGYNTSSGLITNSTARSTQMKYGLSASANYGMQSAMGLLGMSSDEDLMYMNSSQRGVFQELMKKYSAWYDKLESSGVLESIQKTQLEFSIFKQEMAVNLLEWIGKNKDAIFSVIKALLTIVQGIYNVIATLHNINPFNLDNQMSYITGLSELGNSSISSSSKTNKVTVSMNVNATGVLGSEDAMREFFNEQTAQLASTIANQI